MFTTDQVSEKNHEFSLKNCVILIKYHLKNRVKFKLKKQRRYKKIVVMFH